MNKLSGWSIGIPFIETLAQKKARELVALKAQNQLKYNANAKAGSFGTNAKHGGAGPFQVGWEWLTGTGPRHRDFTNGDYFTELLRQHSHIEDTRNLIRGGSREGKNNYNLGGTQGVGLYIKDYSTLLIGGATGNLAVTYLGSYSLTYKVTGISDNGITAIFTITNSSTIESATHPPVIGYTSWWSSSIGQPLNNFFSSGPLSKTTQTFNWTETIRLK